MTDYSTSFFSVLKVQLYFLVASLPRVDFNAASLDCSFTEDFILDVFVFFGEAVYSVAFLVAVPVIVNLHFAKSSFNLFQNNEELLRKIQVFLD